MEPPVAASESEVESDEGEAADIKAKGWDEIDAAIDDDMREQMGAYWNDPDRWSALLEVSRETLERVMGTAGG